MMQVEAKREETTLEEVVHRIREGVFYEDYDWASGPALRALDRALEAHSPTPPKPAEDRARVARELLAVANDKCGFHERAADIRAAGPDSVLWTISLAAIEAALTTSPTVAEAVEWQGIETAPEDDPFVAGLWVKNNQSGEKCWEAYIVVIDDETGEARSFPDDDPLPWALDDFEAWTPLPAPPALSSLKGDR